MTDEPQSPEPPENDDERQPLRLRATTAWNKLGTRSKVGTAIGVAAVVVAGIIAAAQARTVPDADEDKTAADGILAEVARILDQAAAKQDDEPSSSRHPAGGDVGGYWRNQCLDPRRHATGNCRHERRWVPDHTRGTAKDEEEEDAEV